MPYYHTIRQVFLCQLIILPSCSHAIGLGVSGELMHFDYEEFDTLGNMLNREKGWIPGLTFSGLHEHNNITNTLALSIFDGQVDYNGQTQAGQSHQTTTEETILKLMYRLDWSPASTPAAFYGSLYWQRWDRDIQPSNRVSGLFERYQWWTAEAGVQAPFFRDNHQHMFLEMGLLATTSGTIMIDLADIGYGKPTLDLGSDIGFSAKLNYEVLYSSSSSFQFGIQMRRWDFGRSNSKTISNGGSEITITEPDSTSMHTILSAGYYYHF